MDNESFLPQLLDENSFTKLVDQYTIGPYRISIQENAERTTTEAFYTYTTMAEASPFAEVIDSIANNLSQHAAPATDEMERSLDSRFYSLQELFTTRKRVVEQYIHQHYPEFLTMKAIDELIELACYKLIGIYKIAPFLMDDQIEEFYVDCPNTPIYVDHRKWGRCTTPVRLSDEDGERIKTRLRYESGLLLDERTPSLKTELITDRFHVRASLDIFPLAADGLHLDVRKLKRKAFTLPELIANGTLPEALAAYLYFALLRRRTITVIGEPNSGKTTLVNALDLITPPDWRKITIEDVIESVPQQHYDKHQVRFQVIPFEGESTARSKSKEIVKLLHRSPDYVFLGEIQTQEHSQAVFHALTAGLHLIQTCHAASPEQLIVRWVEHHGIAPINLLSLDLIVFMRAYHEGRLVRKARRVSEVEKPYLTQQHGVHPLDLTLKTITLVDSFNLDTQSSPSVTELFDTPTLRDIRAVDALTVDQFSEEITTYIKLFTYLAQNHIFDPATNVRLFHGLHVEKTRHQLEYGAMDWPTLYDRVIEILEQLSPDKSGVFL